MVFAASCVCLFDVKHFLIFDFGISDFNVLGISDCKVADSDLTSGCCKTRMLQDCQVVFLEFDKWMLQDSEFQTARY